MDFDKLINWIKENPLPAVGVTLGAAAIFMFAFRRQKPTAEEQEGEAASTVAPLNAQPGFIPILLNQPTLQSPTEQQVPNTALHTLLREGRNVQVTAGPPGMCPPGYVSAQQPGQPPRCTKLTDTKVKGERRVYFPGLGQGQFVR
jgi:hypothetical protein